MATQAVIYVRRLLPLLLLWLATVAAMVHQWIPPLNNVLRGNEHHVFYAPVYGVIMLGIHAVCSVLYGVAKFNDCDPAKIELYKEIQEAKEELRKRNIS